MTLIETVVFDVGETLVDDTREILARPASQTHTSQPVTFTEAIRLEHI